jgi:hypothetical protein
MTTKDMTFNRRNYFASLKLLVELEKIIPNPTSVEVLQIIDEMKRIVEAATF